MWSRFLTGTLQRKPRKIEDSTESQSLPTTPVAHQRGLRRLDAWIGSLLRDGQNSSPPKEIKEVDEMRQHSPQRNHSPQRPILQNGHDYFPRRLTDNQQQQKLRQMEADYGLGRIQRSVHFDDEKDEADGEQEDEEFVNGRGIGGSHQHAPIATQSNSTPATPLTSNREPFIPSNQFRNQYGDSSRESLGAQGKQLVDSGPPQNHTFTAHQLDNQPAYQNQGKNCILHSGSSTAGSSRAQHILSQLNQQHYPKENRAQQLLHQLRVDDGAQSESDVSTNEPMYHGHTSRMSFGRVGAVNNNTGNLMHSKGVVYLEFNKEFLNQEHVKIYIGDRQSSMADNVLFYELEDLNDVKDQSVLKIHQSQAYRSPPPPLRFTDQLPTDYISEPEIEERAKRYASYKARPASALPETGSRSMQYASSTSNSTPLGISNGNKLQIAKSGPLSSHHFEAYYDPYYSDASSQGPRSGSVTPIIDKETRQRVETMERQLAGLSTLVRSALVQQGNKDSSPDMMDLGRRLLEMQSDAVERFGLSTATNSNSSSMYALMNGKQLVQVRRGVRDMLINLNELRDFVEIDKQTRSDLIRDVFAKIAAHLSEYMKQQQVNSDKTHDGALQLKSQLDAQKTKYEQNLKTLEDAIQQLEQKIEHRRMDVLSRNHKLRMVEVDGLHGELRAIDEQHAQLRDHYLSVEDEACRMIDHYKEQIDQEADFLRREPSTMEQCGRRFQALNNMLATMKKLAIVQDPSVYSKNKAVLEQAQNGQLKPADKLPPKVAPKPNGVLATNGTFHHSANGSNGVANKNEQLPPLPYSPRVTSPNPIRSVSATSTPANSAAIQPNGHSNNATVLDSLLDELNHTASTLPKVLETPPHIQLNGQQQVSLNGRTARVGTGAPNKQVVETSATLTLKEPQAGQVNQINQGQIKTGSIAATIEKYDNINEEQASQPVKPLNGATRIASTDPRRHFVTTETVKYRPTNSGHVVLSTANGRK
ncbi:AIP3 domain-containing protein [Aphelenchoides bicaudatus]|nr:AIP3 domain-containing protein [Aphelenchoides bicaudatus]